jgi:hypothetical protein
MREKKSGGFCGRNPPLLIPTDFDQIDELALPPVVIHAAARHFEKFYVFSINVRLNYKFLNGALHFKYQINHACFFRDSFPNQQGYK